MRIRLTELGLKGLLLLAALELAFLATSYSNLFFLLIVFCTVLGGIGLVTGMRNLRAVRVLGIEVPAGPAGAARPVRLTLHARRRTFDVVVALDDGAAGIVLPPLATLHGQQTVTATMPELDRGVRQVGALRLASRFPFGLFELWRRQPLPLEVVTYPQPTATVPSHARHAHAGGDDGRGAAQPATVAGLRPFRAGDAVRDVHWKATARRGTPIVKEREGEAGDARTLQIDRRCARAELETVLATATEAVLGTASAARDLSLTSQDFAARLPAGQPPPLAVLRWLALADVLPADAGEPTAPRRGQEPAHA